MGFNRWWTYFIVSTSEQDPEGLIVTVGDIKESVLHRFPYHLRLQHPSKIFYSPSYERKV